MTDNSKPICLIINLDRATDRWNYMLHHSQSRGLDVRRIKAADGTQIDNAASKAIFRKIPGRRQLSANEIACFESHKLAWRELVMSDYDYAFVLEDDVFLAHDVATIIKLAVDALPDFSLIKFNNYARPVYLNTKPSAVVLGRKVLRLGQKTIDGSSYLISKRFATTALIRFASFTEELDLALFDPEIDADIFQINPAASVQQKFASFSFLPSAHAESSLEESRQKSQVSAKTGSSRRSVASRVVSELRRFYVRRLWPIIVELTNPFRFAEHRIRRMNVDFTDTTDADHAGGDFGKP